MDLDQLRNMVANPASMNGATFAVFRDVFALTNSLDADDVSLGRDLTIRLLDVRERLSQNFNPLLAALVRAHGLFPYLDPESDPVSDADLLAYEASRPSGAEVSEIVFHEVQHAVYTHLIDGENVILSAPTSFGKSLIIDALLASGRYTNVVVVVPTLALIDETRRRITKAFGSSFKVVTHPSQGLGNKNLFVYTQERIVDQPEFPPIDLFVIDEFYKLDSADEERTGILNQALYRLLKTGAQFYFLGPNVERIAPDLPTRFNARFIQTDFSTVAVDVVSVQSARGTELSTLVELCSSLTEPTLIYCRSPKRTREVVKALLESGSFEDQPALAGASNWIGDTYSPEWLLSRSIRKGLGIHNGRVPRALAQFMIREFNDGHIRFLACTSSLIEGVNTAAKNVIILDDRVAQSRFDLFTFNNIRGRSGRMFRHFVGKVFLFHPEPPPGLPLIDIPLLSQPPSAPSSLLVQLEPDDLTAESKSRIAPLIDQNSLSLDVMRMNSGVSPELQVEVAADLRNRASELHRLLSWRSFPSWEQLQEACNFAWKLSGFAGQVSGVSSGRQMAWKLNLLRQNPTASAYIAALASRDTRGLDGDELVEEALDFTRQWAGHHGPRLLLALDRIQQEVFSDLGMTTGNYAAYAGRVQGAFLPGTLAVVDEYGLPVEIAYKIRERLDLANGVDELLASLRTAPVDELALTPFERDLLLDTVSAIGETTE